MEKKWPLFAQIALLVLLIFGFFINQTLIRYKNHGLLYAKADFGVFYTAGKVLAAQEISPYDGKVFKQEVKKYRKYNAAFRYLYPPTAGLLFAPIAAVFTLKQAAWFWYFISLLCLVGMGWCIQLLLQRRLKLMEWCLIVSVLAISGPIYANLRLGQINIVLAFLFLAQFVAVVRKKEWLAGFLIATLGLIKIFPAVILLYYAVRGQWSVIFKTAIITAVLLMTSIALFGLDVHIEYAQRLAGLHDGIGSSHISKLIAFDNATLYGGSLRAFTFGKETPFVTPFVSIFAKVIRYGSTLAMFVALSLITFRRRTQAPTLYEATLWLGIVLLGAVEIHTQYFIYYLPLLFLLLIAPSKPLQTRFKASMIIVATLLMSYSYMRFVPAPLKDTVLTIVPYALVGHIILIVLLLDYLWHHRNTAGREMSTNSN